jgi:hypothetical protein
MEIITSEEERILFELEKEEDMKEIEELMEKHREGSITQEEEERLRVLLERYGMLDQIEENEERYSEKDENFEDLPPLEVINNLKNSDEESASRQAEDN